jgi:hypothetical protein
MSSTMVGPHSNHGKRGLFDEDETMMDPKRNQS